MLYTVWTLCNSYWFSWIWIWYPDCSLCFQTCPFVQFSFRLNFYQFFHGFGKLCMLSCDILWDNGFDLFTFLVSFFPVCLLNQKTNTGNPREHLLRTVFTLQTGLEGNFLIIRHLRMHRTFQVIVCQCHLHHLVLTKDPEEIIILLPGRKCLEWIFAECG